MTIVDAQPIARAERPRRRIEEESGAGRQGSRLVDYLRLDPCWILVAVSCATLVRAVIASPPSNDTYWQWSAGEWMVTHHAIARWDIFSFTIRGHHWLNEEWGFQVALALLVRVIGSAGFWIVSAGATIVALLASIRRWSMQGARSLGRAALAALGAAFLLIGDAARPQSFSYAFFALELLALALARKRSAWLVSLPPLFALWANSHGSFLAGLGILLIEFGLALPGIRNRIAQGHLRVDDPLRPTTIGCTLGASVLACCINPYGVSLFGYAFHVSTSSQLTRLIEEWQSPNFHSSFLLALVCLPIAVVVRAVALQGRSISAFDLALSGTTLVASLHAQRFLPYFGIAVAGLIASISPVRTSQLKRTVLTAPVAVALVAAVIGAGPVQSAMASSNWLGTVPAAASWLKAHPGRVFSTYDWNDYLISKDIPVFVDGRTDLYFGTGILKEWVAVDTLSTDPDSVLSHWRIEYVLWPPKTALSTFLNHDRTWRVVWRSSGTLIFRRVTPRGAG